MTAPTVEINCPRAEPRLINFYKKQMNAYFERTNPGMAPDQRPYARQNNIRRSLDLYGPVKESDVERCFQIDNHGIMGSIRWNIPDSRKTDKLETLVTSR